MAPHFSILTGKTPWTEEPGRLHRPWGPEELDRTEHAHVLMYSICSATGPHIHHKTFLLYLNDITYPYFSNHAWKLGQDKYEANQA